MNLMLLMRKLNLKIKKKNSELESRMILDEISNSLTKDSNESLFSKNNENNSLFTKGHF